jgi:hypothetical protein
VRVTKRWYTNEDDRVCPVCDLDETDREVEMDEDFSNGFDGPPAHPSCRCWLDVGTRL